MPSAPDENQRSEPLKDILGLTSGNPVGSIVDSVQTLRNLAQELSLAEITETEKKVKQTLEQLGALQETLKRLKKLRLHFNPVFLESQPETRPKNFSKLSAANVIPFPLFSRGSEANTPSEPSATAKRPIADVQDKSESYQSSNQSPHSQATISELQKLRELLTAARSESLSEKTDQKKKQNSPSNEEKIVIGVEAHSESRPSVRADIETSAQEITFKPNEPEPVIPELVIPNEQPVGQENFDLPSKRMAVDKEIKELVKSYGQVDIYSHRENDGKQNLLKAALAGFLLIAVLAASYFFLR